MLFCNSRPLIWYLAPSSVWCKSHWVTQFATFCQIPCLKKLFIIVLSDREKDFKNPLGSHLVDLSLFDYFLFFMRLCKESAIYSSKPHHLKKLKARVINTILWSDSATGECFQQIGKLDWMMYQGSWQWGQWLEMYMSVWNDTDFAFKLYQHHVYGICTPILWRLKMSKELLTVVFCLANIQEEICNNNMNSLAKYLEIWT